MRIVAPVWAFVPKLLTSGIEVGNHSHSFEIKTKNIWLLMYGHKNVKIIDFLKLHTLPYIIVIFSEIGPNSFKFIHGESMLLWILSRIMYTLKCIFRNFTFFKIFFYWCILEPDFLTVCLISWQVIMGFQNSGGFCLQNHDLRCFRENNLLSITLISIPKLRCFIENNGGNNGLIV